MTSHKWNRRSSDRDQRPGGPVMTQERKDGPSNLELGNLALAYGTDIAANWPGCHDQDCLPKCRPSKNHCERLKLWLDRRGLQ